MCKFEIPYGMPTTLRYACYLYYIPMLLLPTVSLYLAFYIRQPENYKLPERRCLLFFPALFLIGIVLTNDLHQLVFTFPEGRLGEAVPYEVGVYGYVKQICGKLPDDMELMRSRILTEHGCFL